MHNCRQTGSLRPARHDIKSVIFTPACRNLENSNQVAGIKFDAHCFVRGLNSIIGYLGFPEPRQARRWNSVPRFFIVTLSKYHRAARDGGAQHTKRHDHNILYRLLARPCDHTLRRNPGRSTTSAHTTKQRERNPKVPPPIYGCAESYSRLPLRMSLFQWGDSHLTPIKTLTPPPRRLPRVVTVPRPRRSCCRR